MRTQAGYELAEAWARTDEVEVGAGAKRLVNLGNCHQDPPQSSASIANALRVNRDVLDEFFLLTCGVFRL